MRLLLVLLLILVGCEGPEPREPAAGSDAAMRELDAAALRAGPVKPGALVLYESDFAGLEGMRVGLVVNHTALVDTVHVIDLFHSAPDVELGALFGPEHGLRGEVARGESVASGRDERTGVPVHSLYGDTRRPTPEMLEGLDALVFDMQEVGARFYTYISTMGLAMQAAAEAGIPFVVLDRPNPLGGELVSGFVLEPAFVSFVGMYPIPVAHGLTVGELARMIQGEGLLDGLGALDLRVVEMEGWQREMQWPETGLTWVPTSPNIPTFETALVYAGSCFFEGTGASEGRGTGEPFKLIGAPWADGEALADTLNGHGLPGVRFEAADFTPRPIPGVSSDPQFSGQSLQGIHYVLTDPAALDPVAAGVHVLHAFYHQAPPGVREGFLDRETLARLAGTDRLAEMLAAGARPEAIAASWHDAAAAFDEARQPYLLY